MMNTYRRKQLEELYRNHPEQLQKALAIEKEVEEKTSKAKAAKNQIKGEFTSDGIYHSF